jgi:hypothetical protein
MTIKCKCGEKNCTTVLNVTTDVDKIDVKIGYESTTSASYQAIELDANGVIALIRELKAALLEIA